MAQGQSAGTYAQSLREILRKMSRNDAKVQVKSLEAVLQLGYEVAKSEENSIAQLKNRNSHAKAVGNASNAPSSRSHNNVRSGPQRSGSNLSSYGADGNPHSNSSSKYSQSPGSPSNRRYKHDPNITQIVQNRPTTTISAKHSQSPKNAPVLQRTTIGKVPGHTPKNHTPSGGTPGRISGNNAGRFSKLPKAPPARVS